MGFTKEDAYLAIRSATDGAEMGDLLAAVASSLSDAELAAMPLTSNDPPLSILGCLQRLLSQKAENALRKEAHGSWPVAKFDSYTTQCLSLPSPSSFGSYWMDFQDPDFGTPIVKCLRPSAEQEASAALVFTPFGEFLDLVADPQCPVDSQSSMATMSLVKLLSKSYANTSDITCLKVTRKFFGNDHQGKDRGAEEKRAELLREALVIFFGSNCPTLSLSSFTQERTSKLEDNDGSWRFKIPNGPEVQILIIEVKEDSGAGGGNSFMQLASSYASLMASPANKPLLSQTCFPALGLEVVGNQLRVLALFMTDRVNCHPLTPMLHFSDLRWSIPGYTESLVRVLVALRSTLLKIQSFYRSPLKPTAARSKLLEDGIPVVLHDRGFDSITRLPGPGHVYLCISDQSAQVVKFVPARSYPEDLHLQLSQKGIAPKLLTPVKLLPGGFWFVEMEYLDPAEGWTPLLAYQGDISALEAALQSAISVFHQCLDGKAVHGDLRPPNIFVRVRDGGDLEVCFIDVDWSGREGEAAYPLFLNGSTISWPVADPVGKSVLQQHDDHMSKESLFQLQKSRQVGSVGPAAAFKTRPPNPSPLRPCIRSLRNSPGFRKWGPVKFL